MAAVLVDSDVFIDHLRGAHMFHPRQDRVSYSVITRSELFAGRGSDEVAVNRLLGAFTEIPVEREVAERAGRLRRSTGMRIPDALIAATALERGLTLVTRNVGDFAGVRSLRIREPR